MSFVRRKEDRESFVSPNFKGGSGSLTGLRILNGPDERLGKGRVFSVNTLNNTLMSMGYVEGDVVSLVMHIRASMQTNAGDNGRNGFIDSDAAIEIPSFEIVFPKGSPMSAKKSRVLRKKLR